MSIRRMFALLLLLGPVQASAASLFASEGHGHHRCTDHVCACARSCPSKKPQKSAAGSCHGAEAPSGPLMSAAGCRHGADGVIAPALVRPHLIPTAASFRPSASTTSVAARGHGDRRPGFLDIDLPPPRLS